LYELRQCFCPDVGVLARFEEMLVGNPPQLEPQTSVKIVGIQHDNRLIVMILPFQL
jgi:hypothetical protein